MKEIESVVSKVRKKILVKVEKNARRYGAVWRIESQNTAPLGFTNKLKAGLTLTYKEGVGLKLSHEWKGGLWHELKPYTHVPRKEVGKVAWYHYGYEYLRNRGRTVDLTSRSKVWLYYLGLNWAYKRNYPSYTWSYCKEAYNRIGGIKTLKDYILKGSGRVQNQHYSSLAGALIPGIRSKTMPRG
jgi:hypothetical protein